MLLPSAPVAPCSATARRTPICPRRLLLITARLGGLGYGSGTAGLRGGGGVSDPRSPRSPRRQGADVDFRASREGGAGSPAPARGRGRSGQSGDRRALG